LEERSAHPCYSEPLLAQTTLKPKGWKFEPHEGIVMDTRGLIEVLDLDLNLAIRICQGTDISNMAVAADLDRWTLWDDLARQENVHVCSDAASLFERRQITPHKQRSSFAQHLATLRKYPDGTRRPAQWQIVAP
jgi:hypothetical protein